MAQVDSGPAGQAPMKAVQITVFAEDQPESLRAIHEKLGTIFKKLEAERGLPGVGVEACMLSKQDGFGIYRFVLNNETAVNHVYDLLGEKYAVCPDSVIKVPTGKNFGLMSAFADKFFKGKDSQKNVNIEYSYESCHGYIIMKVNDAEQAMIDIDGVIKVLSIAQP